MVIVDCLTDNANRTIGDVRHAFTKSKSQLGTPGSVSHLFDHCAIFRFGGQDEDAVLEALMAADVDVTDLRRKRENYRIHAAYRARQGASGPAGCVFRT